MLHDEDEDEGDDDESLYYVCAWVSEWKKTISKINLIGSKRERDF